MEKNDKSARVRLYRGFFHKIGWGKFMDGQHVGPTKKQVHSRKTPGYYRPSLSTKYAVDDPKTAAYLFIPVTGRNSAWLLPQRHLLS